MTTKPPKNDHILLKLRSGEEIIGKRVSAKRGYTGVERPLQINKSSILDPISGQIRKNICVLRNWMEFSLENRCEIPNDYILFTSTPTPEVVERWRHEIEAQDTQGGSAAPQEGPIDPILARLIAGADSTQPQLPPPQESAGRAAMNQIMNELWGKILGSKAPPGGVPPAGPNPQQMVTITMSIPPEVFMNVLFNLPIFDGWGDEILDDEEDEGSDEDDEGDSQKPPPPPKGQAPKGRKPKKDKDDEPPSNGWHGRFGFPK